MDKKKKPKGNNLTKKIYSTKEKRKIQRKKSLKEKRKIQRKKRRKYKKDNGIAEFGKQYK